MVSGRSPSSIESLAGRWCVTYCLEVTVLLSFTAIGGVFGVGVGVGVGVGLGVGVGAQPAIDPVPLDRSEEHTSELQSLMRISYAVFCLKKKKRTTHLILKLS